MTLFKAFNKLLTFLFFFHFKKGWLFDLNDLLYNLLFSALLSSYLMHLFIVKELHFIQTSQSDIKHEIDFKNIMRKIVRISKNSTYSFNICYNQFYHLKNLWMLSRQVINT